MNEWPVWQVDDRVMQVIEEEVHRLRAELATAQAEIARLREAAQSVLTNCRKCREWQECDILSHGKVRRALTAAPPADGREEGSA